MSARPQGMRASIVARELSLGGLLPAVSTSALLIAGWWLLSLTRPRYFLPGPIDVLGSLWDMAAVSGTLWPALGLSLAALALGGLISLAIGVPAGILMGTHPTAEHSLDLYVIGLYVAPVSALTPLLIYWLGLGLAPRVATVVVFAAPEIAIICLRGAREVPQTLIDVARAYGASRQAVLRKVVIHHEVPYIMTAARLGMTRAVKGVVLAEILISGTGLGQLLNEASHDFDTSSLVAVVLVIVLLGIASAHAVAHLQGAVTSGGWTY